MIYITSNVYHVILRVHVGYTAAGCKVPQPEEPIGLQAILFMAKAELPESMKDYKKALLSTRPILEEGGLTRKKSYIHDLGIWRRNPIPRVNQQY